MATGVTVRLRHITSASSRRNITSIDLRNAGLYEEFGAWGIDGNKSSMALLLGELRATSNKITAAKKVTETLYKSIISAGDYKSRASLAETLAMLGGGTVLANILTALMKKQSPSNAEVLAIGILCCTCSEYATLSPELCLQFGRAGLLSDLLKDAEEYTTAQNPNKPRCTSVLWLLLSCSRVAGNESSFRDLRAANRLRWFMECTDLDMAMLSLFTLAYVYQDASPDIPEKLAEHIIVRLKGAFESSHHVRSGEPNLTVIDIISGLCKVARNGESNLTLTDTNILSALLPILEQGDHAERACVIELLYELASTEKNRKEILQATCRIILQILKSGEGDLPAMVNSLVDKLLACSENTPPGKGGCGRHGRNTSNGKERHRSTDTYGQVAGASLTGSLQIRTQNVYGGYVVNGHNNTLTINNFTCSRCGQQPDTYSKSSTMPPPYRET
ncbi:uncharacterized protein [Ptychodera flava]|uniref:uncharacterized protein n=1 Tax=Ptychodera flava TaxID=63121 RepID=UPI003969BD3F